MQFDITQLVVALLGLLATFITGFVIPLLREKAGEYKFDRFLEIVRVGVMAAEQLGGKDKLTTATNRIDMMLNQQGLNFTRNDIRTAIEAFVLEINKELNDDEKDHPTSA